MSSFTVGKKLYLGVGALVVLIVALGVTSFISINSVGENLKNIAGQTIRKQTLAHGISLDNAVMLSLERGIEVRGFMKDVPSIEKYNTSFNTTADDMQASIDSLSALVTLPEAKRALLDLRESLGKVREAQMSLYRSAVKGDMIGSITANTTLLPLHESQRTSALAILTAQEANLKRDAEAANSSIDTSRWIDILLLFLAIFAAAVTIFVVRQVNALLRSSVTELAESAEQIASAATQVSSSSQALAQGSSEQAATIEETSSASSEINSMAQRNTENSRTTTEIVTNSQAAFQRTNQSLSDMVAAMQDIGASSQKISKIIKVIDEIAFQTNILALNAAVEAARAGEAGMGFAVVADEVRNLAQRCAQAAKDTADLIEESIQKSDDGKLKVDHVATAIRGITEESTKIKVLVDEINLGSVEQSRGIDQISRSISQMEQVTQGNAASAEQTAAAAEELSAQAQTLKNVVSRLTIMVDGTVLHPARTSSIHSVRLPKPTPSRSSSTSKATTTFKSKLTFPPSKNLAVAQVQRVSKDSSEFPLDDDFKDF